VSNESPRQNGRRNFRRARPTKLQVEAWANHRNSQQWQSPFARFVERYGVPPLAARLSVERSAVYHWIAGSHQPRAAIALQICELAREIGIDLSLEEVYRHATKPRDCKVGKVEVAPTKSAASPKRFAQRQQSNSIAALGQSEVSPLHAHSLRNKLN
jgi:hypothetical protein